MNLNIDTVERVKALNFLNIKAFDSNKYIEIDNLNFTEKKINSIKWENFILERSGDFTVYLAVNHKDVYNKYWNKLAVDITKNVEPCIKNKLDKLIENNKFKPTMKDQILYDFINILIILSYNEYYHSLFFEELLKIHEHGYIPCNWIMDAYPKGRWLFMANQII